VTTRSLKRGAVWRIDIKKKGDFRQKVWAALAFGDFSPNKKRLDGIFSVCCC
jgi:hypothetical protein